MHSALPSSAPAPLASDASGLATVQALYAALDRGDLPTLLGLLAPDVQWRFIGGGGLPHTASVCGREGVQSWLGQVLQHEDLLRFEPREFMAGAGHVTVVGWEQVLARPTGREFSSDWMHVFQVQDRQITRFLGICNTEAAARAFAPDGADQAGLPA